MTTGQAEIIAIANRKGGVGKTTTAVNLAYELAAAGHEVCVVDLDSQASLTTMFLGPGAKPPEAERFAAAILEEGREIGDLRLPVGERLVLIPGGEALARTAAQIAPSNDGQLHRYPYQLADVLDSIIRAHRFIVLDLPGTLDSLSDIALAAADRVIIPTVLRQTAIVSTGSYLHRVRRLRGRGPDDERAFNGKLVIHGILPTMVSESSATAQMRSFLHETFGAIPGQPIRILDEIPYSEWAPQAELYGTAAAGIRPRSSVALAYRSLAAGVIAEVCDGV